MRRIRLDFSLTAEDAQARLRRQIPDLTPAEFAAWDAAGLLEHQVIDGRTLYFNRAPSNLFRLSEAAVKRRSSTTPPWTDGPMETANAHHREVRDQALKTGKHRRSAPPRTGDVFTDRECRMPFRTARRVRAWLPFPRALPGQQENVRLVESTPATHVIAPESALQRTVYLEQPADAGKPTMFSITYELTVFGQYHPIDPAKVAAASRARRRSRPYLAERAAAHRVHSRDPQVLARDRRRGNQPVPHRAEAVRRGRSHSVGRRARILHDLQHQRLRAARRPRRLRPADAAADDAAAAERHSHALAVRLGLLRRRLRQHARLGAALSTRPTAGCRWM